MNPLRPLDVSAFVLAGGLGTRLRPVTGDRPKPLAPVGGRPFIEILLDQLRDAGFRHVVLCTGYRAAEVRAAVGAARGPLAVEYSEEPCPLGTGGALRLALPLARSETILVSNGDSYLGLPLPSFLERHDRSGAMATLALKPVPDTGRFGRVETSADGRVLAFREKSGGEGVINAGIYLFRTELVSGIPERACVSLEREVIPGWIDRGIHISGALCDNVFFDIGTPDSHEAADAYFTSRLPVPPGKTR
ncbi:MAG TPA: nucleotidyltransferase family protein [Candidatus Deferrimicrobiaceae bacterium]